MALCLVSNKIIMIRAILIFSFFALGLLNANAQENLLATNKVTQLEVITAPDEPNYTFMAQRDAKKYFSTKKPFWTGVVCGFMPVVGWVAAPIIGASVKLKEQQMWNPANNNNFLRESNTTYATAYKKYCLKKRSKNFVFGFTIGFAAIAGYYFATQPEYKK